MTNPKFPALVPEVASRHASELLDEAVRLAAASRDEFQTAVSTLEGQPGAPELGPLIEGIVRASWELERGLRLLASRSTAYPGAVLRFEQ